MPILFYITTRFKRSPSTVLLLALLLAILCTFSTLFSAFIVQKERDIDATYDGLPVTLVVSNITGTKTNGLDIYEYTVDYFLSDNYSYNGKVQPRAFSTYVKDVAVKGTLYYTTLWTPTASVEKQLSGLTSPALAVEFPEVEGAQIACFSGWNESIFDTSEPACIVPEELLGHLTPDEDGQYGLELSIQISSAATQTQPLFLEVVGTYSSDSEVIYCPWAIIAKAQRDLVGQVRADYLRAVVRDNRELDELRVLLARHFDEVSPSGHQEEWTESPILLYKPYAITVHDESLREILNSQNRNLQTLYRLKPVLTGIELALAAIALFYYFHIRRMELAVACSLGTSRMTVLAAVLLETTLLGLIGVLLGMTPLLLLPSLPIQWGTIAGILLFALSGATVSGLTATGRKGIQLLKEVE